jgi:hypothetical protein
MELKNEEGKINFILAIFTDFGRALTGGVVAMHKLAYDLAIRGHNVYVFCKPEYPHKNIIQIKSEIVYTEGFLENFTWEGFSYLQNNTVSIYPQICRGNPFNTFNNVRWILYDTEKDIEDGYGEHDIYFNYGSFKTFKNVEDKKLTVFNYYFDKLYKTNDSKRKGFCHLFHKHTPPNGNEIINHLKSFDLSDWKIRGCHDYLREVFNQYEYFITYDQKSFFTLAAGLCGCKSIILNSGPSYEFSENAWTNSSDYHNIMTPTEYRLQNPIQMFGVAYGWDDIQWANNTIDMVRPHLEEMEKIDNKTVDNFISYWKDRLKL